MTKLRAVIVAAGRGTRLYPYTRNTPKCLLEVEAGVSLLDFQIKLLREVKVEEIIVATRPEYVDAIKSRVGESVRIVEVRGEDYGNLYSFYTAAKNLEEDSVLAVMSDHLFEPEILRRIVSADGDAPVILCLDREPEWREAEEGLRIREKMRVVLEAGKKLKEFSGVDTGLFLINAEGLRLIRKVIEEKGAKAVFADLVNYAAAQGKAAYVDVTGRLWMDIDVPEDLVKARKLYREILRRTLYKPSDGPVSTYINRPISTRISLLLYRHLPWLKPNHVTILSFLLSIAAAFLIAWNLILVGGIVAQLSSIIDGVDGELARLREEVTRFGGFFDTVLDRFADLAIVVALGIYSLQTLPLLHSLILTSLASAGVVLVSYVSIAAGGRINLQRLRRGFPWATRDVRLFTVMVGGLLNQPLIPLIYCAATPPIFAAKAIILYRKKAEKPAPKLPELRPPRPELMEVKERPRRRGAIRENLTALFTNAFKLIIILALTYFTSILCGDVGLQLADLIRFNVSHILTAINIVAIIYFGYKILMVLKFFTEEAADQLVRSLEITGSTLRRVGVDLLYLSTTLLVWIAASSVIGYIPEELWILRIFITLIIAVFFLLILYDLVRVFYREMRGVWERFLERLEKRG